jgi:hypothetical protein
MLTLYWAFLLFGGTLLLFSIFSGADGDTDLEFDVDSDLTLDIEGDIGAGVGGEGLAAAAQYLSFRNLVFFAAFFGLTGTVLHYLHVPGAVTLFLAIVMGLGAAGVSHKLMAYLRDSQSGEVGSLSDLEGLQAKVFIDVSRDRKGKISVTGRDQRMEIVAIVAEESRDDSFKSGDTVTIVRVAEGVAQIAREDYIA